MAPKTIPLKPFLVAVAGLAFLEFCGSGIKDIFSISPMPMLAMIRLMEIGFLVLVLKHSAVGLSPVGFDGKRIVSGIKRGLIWSIGFGGFVSIIAGILFLSGFDPTKMVRARLPQGLSDLILYVSVGSIIAPVAEEIFFRGFLFGYIRKWGVIPAVVGSTFIFAFYHDVGGLPVTQLVGGLLFSVSYEIEKNLVAPMVIHILGNSAIFFLTLITSL